MDLAETGTGEKSRHRIRPYRAEDRAAVRAICADTGFLGKPIDPVFEDRELFADYLTGYYTDAEPESTFVCEFDGVVKGYLLGCRFPRKKDRHELLHNPLLALRGLWRYVARPYNAASRRYVKWILTRARQEVPFTPPGIPHFHFNMLPEARSYAATGAMVDAFLQYLAGRGQTQVYGQVVTFEERRSVRLFERFGFQVIDRREVTKYRDLHDGKVFLFTILRDNLAENARLYGAKAGAPAA